MNLSIPESETNYPTPFASSPLFPLLYFSLYFSQKHTPDTSNYVLPKYDYIIVGAGSAGATLAARLSEVPCVTVLLLEAGKSPPLMTEILAIGRSFFKTDIDWGYLTTPQNRTGLLLNNRQLLYPRGKAVGGSSVFNGAVYARGSRHIYDQWEEQGAAGWSYKDVLPYFIKAENNLNPESIDKGYHGFHGPMTVEDPRFESPYKSAIYNAIPELGYQKVDSNGRIQKGFYSYQTNTRIGQRCSTGKAYLVPAESRTNLHIVKNAMVTKILFSTRQKQAVGVQFTTSGRSFEILASREVIVSAGSVNTPQLLMLSGVGPKKHLDELGIPVVADLPVGLNLQDHFASFHLYYTTEFAPFRTEITNSSNILQYIQERSGPLTTSDGQQYIAFLSRERNTSDDAVPDYQLFFFHTDVSALPVGINLQQKVYEQIFKPYENTSTILCASQLLTPKSRGFIKLQSSDPSDPPIIEPNFIDKSYDLENIVEGMKKCDRMFNTRALKSLGFKPFETKYPGCEMFDRYSEDYLKCAIKSISLTIYHPTSTCTMGNPNSPTTVVDPLLRVKGIRGLRVVDASVMPIIPSGNTNAPTIMVAEKAADIIKEKLKCGKDFNY